MNLHIRPYHPPDMPNLIDIFEMNVPDYFAINEVNDFEQYLFQKSATYLTIERDGQIIGGAGYYINVSDHSGRITWIFFHPESKGSGAGKRAVDHCLNLLKADPTVEKLVVTTSQFAFKFFEKFGYEVVRTEKGYWGKGLDLYLMEMRIQS